MRPSRSLEIIAYCALIMTALAMGAAIKDARAVLLPFTLALLGAYACEPAVRALQRFRVPRPLAVTFVLTVLIAAVRILAGVLVNSVVSLVAALPNFESQLSALLALEPFPALLGLPEGSAPGFSDLIAPFADQLQMGSLAGTLSTAVGSLAGILSRLMIIILLMMVMLYGRRELDQRFLDVGASASGDASTTRQVMREIDSQVQRYLVVKTVVSIVTGLVFGLAMGLLGVRFAVLWGFLAFILNYIPTIGPIVATVPPIVMALLQATAAAGESMGDLPSGSVSDLLSQISLGWLLLTTAVAAGIQFVSGNVVEPKVMGDTMNLNFLAVLFTLFLAAYLWGAAGMVVSIPITATINIICAHVDALRPLHLAMKGGRR